MGKKNSLFFLACLVGSLALMTFPANAQSKEFWVSWKADTFTPAFYEGKALPIDNSSITVGFDLLNDGKILNLNNKEVRWFINNNLANKGIGLKKISFTPPKNSNDITVQIQILSAGAEEANAIVLIPIFKPKVVIDASYLNKLIGQGVSILRAWPYFFNVFDINNLSFRWAANGQESQGKVSSPNTLELAIPEKQALTEVTITVSAQNKFNPLEVARDAVNFKINIPALEATKQSGSVARAQFVPGEGAIQGGSGTSSDVSGGAGAILEGGGGIGGEIQSGGAGGGISGDINALPQGTSLPPAECGPEGTGYRLCVPIPGQPGTVSDLSDYIKLLYQFALAIAGVIVFVRIVYGGIMYTLSAGNVVNRTEATDIITKAILGLALLLAATLILYIINPELLKIGSSFRNGGINFNALDTAGPVKLAQDQVDNYMQKSVEEKRQAVQDFKQSELDAGMLRIEIRALENDLKRTGVSPQEAARISQELSEKKQMLSALDEDILNQSFLISEDITFRRIDEISKDPDAATRVYPDVDVFMSPSEQISNP